MTNRTLFARAGKKHYAFPSEHGAWIWWIGPMAAAFAAMSLDTMEGVLHPAVGVRPAAIGIRQLVMSTLFVAMLVTGYLL